MQLHQDADTNEIRERSNVFKVNMKTPEGTDVFWILLIEDPEEDDAHLAMDVTEEVEEHIEAQKR